MPVFIKIETKTSLVRKALEQLRLKIPKVGRKRLYDAARLIAKRMHKPGDEIEYPVHWDSKKQRRAFFATDGFGAGIPTQRT